MTNNRPFAVDVELGSDYFWCSCGQSKKQPFAMAAMPVLISDRRSWRPKRLKPSIYVAAKRQRTAPSAMEVIRI